MAPASPANHAWEPRLIHEYIREASDHEPERICLSFHRSKNPEDGLVDVSSRQLSNAVDFASLWLKQHVGIGKNYETLGYVGPQDSRYLLLALGAVNTGWKVGSLCRVAACLTGIAFCPISSK